MKRLLLDTHDLLWWLSDDSRLGIRVKKEIMDSRNPVWVSAATVWEIGIKKALGKLQAPNDMDRVIEDEGFEKLTIDCNHAEAAPLLPPYRKDHSDRMLIAQAQMEGLILVTADEKILQYPVRTLKCG